MSDFDPDVYLSQSSAPQAAPQSFNPDQYLSQPSIPSAPPGVQAGPQTPKFTPQQMLDPRYVAAIDRAYGLHHPLGEAIANIGTKIEDMPQSAGNAVQNYAIKQGAGPYTAAGLGEGTELGINVLEGLPFAGVGGARTLPNAPSYAAAEEAEANRLGDIHARAEARGLQIVDQGTPETIGRAASNNQSIVDNTIKGNFGLSPNAPATPQMLDGWRSSFVKNSTYAEARAVPKVQLNDDAVESLANLPKPLYDRLGLDAKISPSNAISGDDAVDVSQALRARASQLWKTSKMFPEYEDQAVAMDQAVDHLEDSVAPNLKDPEQWNLDRAKIAQSYDAQSALDGGHFDARDLARLKFAKNQIKPWTGDMSDIADLAQLHPDSFQLTRTTLPKYSLLRRGLTWGAGAAASYAAGKAGLGAVSHLIGQQTSNAITPQ
jgi:hypothetical protein